MKAPKSELYLSTIRQQMEVLSRVNRTLNADLWLQMIATFKMDVNRIRAFRPQSPSAGCIPITRPGHRCPAAAVLAKLIRELALPFEFYRRSQDCRCSVLRVRSRQPRTCSGVNATCLFARLRWRPEPLLAWLHLIASVSQLASTVPSGMFILRAISRKPAPAA